MLAQDVILEKQPDFPLLTAQRESLGSRTIQDYWNWRRVESQVNEKVGGSVCLDKLMLTGDYEGLRG